MNLFFYEVKDIGVNCPIFARIRSSEVSYLVLDNSIAGFLDKDFSYRQFLGEIQEQNFQL